MHILTGRTKTGIVMQYLTENEFLDMISMTDLGRSGTNEKQLVFRHTITSFFKQHTNVIFSNVYFENNIMEYFNSLEYVNILGGNAKELAEDFKRIDTQNYVVDLNCIMYANFYGFKLNLLPLDNVKLPQKVNNQLRMILIDDFLKELC